MLQELDFKADATAVARCSFAFGFDAIMAQPDHRRFRAWYDRTCRLPKKPSWPSTADVASRSRRP